MIIKSSTEFYNDLKADEHDRYRSWGALLFTFYDS